MKHLSNRFKKGAASFYIVAFSTLILVIIAASFAMVIISEVTRTSNDDLSQSAYDAALAGVEDAKLAYLNYKKCTTNDPTNRGSISEADAAKNDPSKITCGAIIYWIEHPESQDCGTVARILGRSLTGDGVQVSETTGGNNRLAQYYTCVKINTILQDYRANLSASMPAKVVKVELDNVKASQIEKVKLSWYSGNKGATTYNFTNVNNSGVSFPPLSNKVATPPTISLSLIQTGGTFNLSDFEKIDGDNKTNRGTIYLVPTDDDKNLARNGKVNNSTGIYNGTENIVSAATIVKSNNRSVENLPLATYCNTSTDSEFVCSATINLPQPLDGDRSNETFMFVVSLPYGQPDTDFALEFLCKDGVECSSIKTGSDNTESSNVAFTKGIQVSIDSTGRANDLFRRVEAHLESTDTGFPYPFYAIQVLEHDSGKNALEKNLTVTREYGDYSGWFSSSNY